jgi:probable lipoprotein (TIGR04455 family)
MRAENLGALLVAVALTGCATVRMHRVREDYDSVDRTRTKRLVVVTQPLPDGQPKAGELFSLVARRYVNQKRNFLVKDNTASADAVDVKKLCAEGIEGVLQLAPNLKRVGEGVEGELKAQLLRCTDGQEVWAAEAGGSFESKDARLADVTAQYVSEIGAEVEPYVAPAFNLLRPTLDTLPNPDLTEEDINEKIELGE